jgi:8-oxo-dGTP pyrophosphatase MutT (NUDIX family)
MRAGVIIIQNNQILLIHRRKNGLEYFVLPGGGVEAGETPEQAAVREAKEETGLDVILTGAFIESEDERDHNPHRYYHVASFLGELALGGEEAIINNPDDSYELEWHPLTNLKTLTVYPVKLIEEIL